MSANMLTARKLRILFLKHLHVIGTIMCFVYVFLFLYLNDSYNKFVNASKSSITITTYTNASNHHPNKSKLSFNKHVSHPWYDDPDCKNFTVQVCFQHLIKIKTVFIKQLFKMYTFYLTVSR